MFLWRTDTAVSAAGRRADARREVKRERGEESKGVEF
jgi:hypothetical protein